MDHSPSALGATDVALRHESAPRPPALPKTTLTSSFGDPEKGRAPRKGETTKNDVKGNLAEFFF